MNDEIHEVACEIALLEQVLDDFVAITQDDDEMVEALVEKQRERIAHLATLVGEEALDAAAERLGDYVIKAGAAK